MLEKDIKNALLTIFLYFMNADYLFCVKKYCYLLTLCKSLCMNVYLFIYLFVFH